jgi:hypothetical protein
MCAVSMIMDARGDDWQRRWLQRQLEDQYRPYVQPTPPIVTQQEIDEFRRLLERAREWDKEHGQPDCEMEEKREKLRSLAKDMGIEIAFV